MQYIVKNTPDNRGISDIASALFVKRGGDTKYHLRLCLTNIPATGSEPETLDTTVTSSRTKTSTPGRIDPGQKTCTFLAHRDNFEILKKDHRKNLDFLQVNPDGTGYKYQGIVTSYQDETSVGSNMTGKAIITVTSADELPINNVIDLIQESVTFVSAIDAVVKVAIGGTEKLNIETDPSDATITAESDTNVVATVAVANGIATVTGVKKGSAIVKIKATKDELAEGLTHVLVIVE